MNAISIRLTRLNLPYGLRSRQLLLRTWISKSFNTYDYSLLFLYTMSLVVFLSEPITLDLYMVRLLKIAEPESVKGEQLP
jgi:hypothetical protein